METCHWNSEFSHSTWWFSIAMWNYQRVRVKRGSETDNGISHWMCNWPTLWCVNGGYGHFEQGKMGKRGSTGFWSLFSDKAISARFKLKWSTHFKTGFKDVYRLHLVSPVHFWWPWYRWFLQIVPWWSSECVGRQNLWMPLKQAFLEVCSPHLCPWKYQL